jgi:hypothetical protein
MSIESKTSVLILTGVEKDDVVVVAVVQAGVVGSANLVAPQVIA